MAPALKVADIALKIAESLAVQLVDLGFVDGAGREAESRL